MDNRDRYGLASIYRHRAKALRNAARTLDGETRRTLLAAADKWDLMAADEELHWSGGALEEE